MGTLYVAPAADGGSDAAAGTYVAPKATVGGAHSAASGGDTIVLKTSANVHAFANLTLTKNLTIEGESTRPIDQILDGGSTYVKWKIESSSIEVAKKNLIFQNAKMLDRYGIFAIYNTGSVVNAAAWYAENCHVRDIISDISDWGCGIWTLGYQAPTNCIIDIRRCAFYNLSRSATGYKLRIVGHYASTGHIVNFYHNVVFSKTGIAYPLSGVFQSASAGGTLNYKNNILVDAAAGSIPSTGTGAFSTINKGCNGFYGFADDGGTGSLTSDPLFVDPANNNFNLQVDSPYIGAGVTP